MSTTVQAMEWAAPTACRECGTAFEGRTDKEFCSDRCRKRASRKADKADRPDTADSAQANSADTVKADKPIPHRKPGEKLSLDERLAQLLKERNEARDRLGEMEQRIQMLEAELRSIKDSAALRKQETEKAFGEGLARVRACFPDYDSVVGRLRPLPPDVEEEIHDNPNGALLLYHMGRWQPSLHGDLASLVMSEARPRIRRLCVELQQRAEQTVQQAAQQEETDRTYRQAATERLRTWGAN